MKWIFRKIHATGSDATAERLGVRYTLLTMVMSWMIWAQPAVAASVLQGIEHTTAGDSGVRVVVTADSVFDKVPANFSIDNPPRVVVDLADTTIAMEQKRHEVGAAGVESIDAVEAAGRTRLVVNLSRDLGYRVFTENNQLILTLGDVPSGTALAAPVGEATVAQTPDAAAEKSSSVGANAQGSSPITASSPAATMSPGPSITNLDFRRTGQGSGQVIINLSGSDVTVEEDARSGRVVLELAGVSVPDEVQKSYDVTDFATPVRSVKIEPLGMTGARVEIRATGSYDHKSHNAGNAYVVEFSPKKAATQAVATKSSTKTAPGAGLREKSYSGQRVSLNFQDIEVRSVLQLLADFTGLNMVVSDTVQGNITLRLKDVPWDQALDIILTAKGLTHRRYGNVIMVAPIEEVAARERLELEAEKQIEELAPLVSELIQVNYAKAEELAEILKQQENRLMSERGNVTVDARTNTMLVQDTAQSLNQIRQLVTDLDRPVRQVLIESRVVVANDEFARELGVRFGFSAGDSDGDTQWLVGGTKSGGFQNLSGGDYPYFVVGGEGEDAGDSAGLLVNLPTALGGARGGALGLVVGKLGDWLLQLELSAMQQEGRGEIVASPRVITSDQQKALIKQGIEIPYQEATSSGATNVTFKEAVLELEVTPHITPDDRVIMDLGVSQDNPDWSRSVLGVPPIDTRSVETSVLVDNGETVVLGGVFEEQDSVGQEKVPFFGDLPGVGHLFRNDLVSRQKRELLIFVTPKILKESLSVGR